MEQELIEVLKDFLEEYKRANENQTEIAQTLDRIYRDGLDVFTNPFE